MHGCRRDRKARWVDVLGSVSIYKTKFMHILQLSQNHTSCIVVSPGYAAGNKISFTTRLPHLSAISPAQRDLLYKLRSPISVQSHSPPLLHTTPHSPPHSPQSPRLSSLTLPTLSSLHSLLLSAALVQAPLLYFYPSSFRSPGHRACLVDMLCPHRCTLLPFPLRAPLLASQ